jgi:hypothetical protein
MLIAIVEGRSPGYYFWCFKPSQQMPVAGVKAQSNYSCGGSCGVVCAGCTNVPHSLLIPIGSLQGRHVRTFCKVGQFSSVRGFGRAQWLLL